MLKYIVVVWTVVQLIGTAVYIREMIYGTVKPNRMTRLIRAVAPLISTAAAISDGVRRAVLPVFGEGLWPLLILITSFFNSRAYRKLWYFDYICGFFSIMALILWRITKEPLLAIMFAIISDLFATTPTIMKSWNSPKSESVSTYSAWLLCSSTAFFAMQAFSLSEMAFPIYTIFTDILVIIILYRKQIKEITKRLIKK